jgi:hypothetical protein
MPDPFPLSPEPWPKCHLSPIRVDHGSPIAAQAPRVRYGVPITEAQPKRHVCAGGVPSPQAGAQAPRVPTWFFFDSNNIFLKFINDDNNNTHINF